MKVAMNRKELMDCLRSMIRVVPKTSAVMELIGFLIECNDEDGYVSITATNLETTIRRRFKANIELGGGCVAAAAMIFKMVSLLDGDTVELTLVRRGILTIKSGDCTYTIPVLDADNYPKIALPFPEDMLKIKGICTLYAKTANTVANKDTYPVLAGIRLELYSDAIRAIGCDTFRMAIANMDCNCGGKLAVTIPKQSFFYLANAVTDADELQIGICDNSVVFMKEGLVFSTRCIPGSYLDIDRLISSGTRTEIASVKGEDWRRVAETVSTITNIGGDTAPVELRIEQGELLVKIESQNASSTQSVSAAVKNMAGEVFYYPPKAITDAHKVVKGDIKLEMTGRGIMYLSNKTGMYMIMNTKKRSVKEKKQPAKTKSQKTDVKKAA